MNKMGNDLHPACDRHIPLGENVVARFNTGKPGWLITFIDLISLLLAFFVMMFSMSSLKMPEWEIFLGTTKNSNEVSELSDSQTATQNTVTESSEDGRGIDLGYLRSILEAGMNNESVLQAAAFTQEPGRLIISLPTKLFFQQGSAIVSSTGEKALFLLSEKLSNLKNKISLVGHSDPSPMASGADYSNNWALSLARANSVAQSLLKFGYRKPIRISSFADTKFQDVSKTIFHLDTYSLARRVDLVVHLDRDYP